MSERRSVLSIGTYAMVGVCSDVGLRKVRHLRVRHTAAEYNYGWDMGEL
jgi:hypothetical protein